MQQRDRVTVLVFALRTGNSKRTLFSFCARNDRKKNSYLIIHQNVWILLKLNARLFVWAVTFQYSDLKLLDLVKKRQRNGQFYNYLMFFCGSKCRGSHHSYFSYPDFFKFLLKIYYSCSHKTPIKRGITFVVSSQKDLKGTILSSRDHFERRD